MAEPCRESWDNMLPHPGGRHCASCNKIVLDFVGKSDAEIMRVLQHQKIISANALGSACGRFTSKQLNRPLELQSEEKSPDLLKWLAGLLLAGSAGQALSQELPDSLNKMKSSVQLQELSPDSLAAIPDTSTGLRFEGEIVDKGDRQSLSNVRVRLTGTELETHSDEKGRFSLLLPPAALADSLPLSFSFYREGFELKFLMLTLAELEEEQRIEMKTYEFYPHLKEIKIDISIVSGNFIPVEHREIQRITEISDFMEIKAQPAHSENYPGSQINRSGRGWLSALLLQAVLPSRRRKNKKGPLS